jgi:hypothetical protein
VDGEADPEQDDRQDRKQDEKQHLSDLLWLWKHNGESPRSVALPLVNRRR